MTIEKSEHMECESLNKLDSYGGLYLCENKEGCPYGKTKIKTRFCPVGGIIPYKKEYRENLLTKIYSFSH